MTTNLISAKNPKVSIVILNWNGIKDTIECIDTLMDITYNNYEIFVIDNNSLDNEALMLEQKYTSYVKVIKSGEYRTIQQAKNLATQNIVLAGQTKYILFLDNDILVTPDFLSILLYSATLIPNVGIVGPKIFNYYDTRRLSGMGGFFNYWTGFHHEMGFNNTVGFKYKNAIAVDYVTPTCMLVAMQLINKIGMWDETIVIAHDDTDICKRATDSGFKVLLSTNSEVFHKERSRYLVNVGGKRIGLYIIARFRFMYKHCNVFQFVTSSLCYFLLEIPYLILKYLLRRTHYHMNNKRTNSSG